jgi:hypothetical protein
MRLIMQLADKCNYSEFMPQQVFSRDGVNLLYYHASFETELKLCLYTPSVPGIYYMWVTLPYFITVNY